MDYIITYAKIKHGRVRLLPDMTLKLTIPFSKSKDKNFENILLSKGKILIQKLEKKKRERPKTITEESIFIFGEERSLNEIREDRYAYLKQKLHEVTIPILEKYSSLLGIPYNKVYIKDLKTRWGSCSGRQNISLNLKLVHFPHRLLEYVIIHEVCHLKEKNHSVRFWDLVEEYCPDYKSFRKELRQII